MSYHAGVEPFFSGKAVRKTICSNNLLPALTIVEFIGREFQLVCHCVHKKNLSKAARLAWRDKPYRSFSVMWTGDLDVLTTLETSPGFSLGVAGSTTRTFPTAIANSTHTPQVASAAKKIAVIRVNLSVLFFFSFAEIFLRLYYNLKMFTSLLCTTSLLGVYILLLPPRGQSYH